MRRPAAALAALVVAAAAAVLGMPTDQASASSPSSCTSTTGTMLAVDYHHWGGPIVRGCDLQNPAHGNDLLDDLGFTHYGDQHDGQAFICRIGNQAWAGGKPYPTPSQDPCVVTPPASAYWSYWLAPAGQNHWSYSQLGAYSEVPKKGEVELWIFGGTDIQGSAGDPVNGFPTCTPNSLRAGGSPTSCTPTGTSAGKGREIGVSHRKHGTTGGRHPSGSGGSTNGGGAGSASGGGNAGPAKGSSAAAASSAHPAAVSSAKKAAASSAATSSAPSARPGSGTTTTTVDSNGKAVAVDAKPASKTIDSGSAVPLVVGLCLFVLVGGGAGYTVWRRRRADGHVG